MIYVISTPHKVSERISGDKQFLKLKMRRN